jgi:hypothetical protein
MYIGLHVKYPSFLSDFNETDFQNILHTSNFMKLQPVGATLFQADGWMDGWKDGQTDRHVKGKSHLLQFCKHT